MVPSYGTRPATDAEINALLEARGIEMYVVDMDDVIFVTPGRGKKPPRVFIAAHLRASERRFWLLHDIVHFFVGDADEHARHDDYDPYPIFEQRADVVAALGVLPVKSRSGDAQWFDLQLDELVPTKHVAWTVFRRPSTADMVSRVFSERVA